ncbi:tRNA lysidine(34) synthetase TilS [Spongiactinospora sp. TRM90649]|uniref:tRNA lysidine(34) synthetase TilS n=1 Tax=Spongiactinospora sp. TRM90649 TaxID=3031114 RepID=UPI0023F72C0D|nr:tRNA lysidine(34) synthetase TilS [Spongiactinospora sp. TRM90649]MDF5758909.1 tRNA lysidine(34) synthetase TilS [Spongiactinospora sp. TRM90649]
MGPRPAVADVRRAVRAALADLPAGSLALVAASGGADSLALAAATGFEAPRAGLRAGLVTVDHGLQDGSAARAATVVELAAGLGLDPAEAIRVEVGRAGGPEAAARQARYAALEGAAKRLGAAAVLLGHTLDDQAETVLLGLARGSGVRSLSGMAARSGLYLRPLLGLSRSTTRAACAALDLTPWDDPHNEDARFTRVRVRGRVLPVLESELGPGIADALARTAVLCREDADALDAWAGSAYANARVDFACSDIAEGPSAAREGGEGVALAVSEVEGLPAAVRRRVLRRAAIEAGSPPGTLSAAHVLEIDKLVAGWRGQRGIDLPGGVAAVRRCGTLILARKPG